MEYDIDELEYLIKNWEKDIGEEDIRNEIKEKVKLRDSLKSLIKDHINSIKVLIKVYKDASAEVTDLELQLLNKDGQHKENKPKPDEADFLVDKSVNTDKLPITNNPQGLKPLDHLKTVMSNRTHTETNSSAEDDSSNNKTNIAQVTVDPYVFDIFKEQGKFMHVRRVAELLGGESVNSKFKGYGSLVSKVSHAVDRLKRKGVLVCIRIGLGESTHGVVWGGINWVKDKDNESKLTINDIKDEYMYEQKYLPSTTPQQL